MITIKLKSKKTIELTMQELQAFLETVGIDTLVEDKLFSCECIQGVPHCECDGGVVDADYEIERVQCGQIFDDKTWIGSEISELEDILESLPEDRVIERSALIARIEALKKDMQENPNPAQTPIKKWYNLLLYCRRSYTMNRSYLKMMTLSLLGAFLLSGCDGLLNDDPVAKDDAFSITFPRSPKTVFSLDVLQNDIEVDEEDTLTISALDTGECAGKVEKSEDGTFVRYTPPPTYQESDTFAYTVSDGKGGTSTAEVVIAISPEGSEAAGLIQVIDDTATAQRGGDPVVIDVLGNDKVIQKDTVTAELTGVGASKIGATVTIQNGKVYYTPPADKSGHDSFEYKIKLTGTSTGDVTTYGAVSVSVLPQWDFSEKIESMQGDITKGMWASLELASTKDGKQAVAAWVTNNGPDNTAQCDVWAKVLKDGVWQSQEKLWTITHCTSGLSWNKQIQIKMDETGRALLGWRNKSQDAGDVSEFVFHVKAYTPAGGWEYPGINLDGREYIPAFDMSLQGNKIKLLWADRHDTGDRGVWLSSLSGTSLADPEHIDLQPEDRPYLGMLSSVEVVETEEGETIIGWSNDKGVFSKKKSAGGVWNLGGYLKFTHNDDDEHTHDFGNPVFAAGGKGNVAAVWTGTKYGDNNRTGEKDGVTYLYAATYSPVSGWTSGRLIFAPGTDERVQASTPVKIRGDGKGGFVATWDVWKSEGDEEPYRITYSASTAGHDRKWSVGKVMADYAPNITDLVSLKGTGVVGIGIEDDGTHADAYLYMNDGSGWKGRMLVENDNRADVSSPVISKGFVAVWLEKVNGAWTLWNSRLY